MNDTQLELAGLEQRVGDLLGELTFDQKSCLADVRPHLGDHHDGGRWVEQFSPLTLLYPMLHAEGIVTLGEQRARDLGLAQFLFVVHAFLDDRIRDGQIADSEEHNALNRWLVQRAVDEVGQVLGSNDLARDLLAAYESAQTTRPQTLGELEDLVVGRHLLGVVATSCLLERRGVGFQVVNETSMLFRHLVLSLQWFDDLKDLCDDLETGADNLLIASLGLESARERGAILARLFVGGVFHNAFERTTDHLRQARGIAGGLGCIGLERMLEERGRWVAEVGSSFLESQDEVVRQFAQA